MGIKISITGSKMNSADIMNHATIDGENDVDINIDKSEILDKLELLNDSEINSMKKDLLREIEMMDKDSSEYKELSNLVRLKGNLDDKSFAKRLKGFVSDFSQGFLAEFLSSWLMNNIH